MTQGRRLLDDPDAGDLVAPGGDLGQSFDDVVDVALRVDAARNRQAYELVLGIVLFAARRVAPAPLRLS